MLLPCGGIWRTWPGGNRPSCLAARSCWVSSAPDSSRARNAAGQGAGTVMAGALVGIATWATPVTTSRSPDRPEWVARPSSSGTSPVGAASAVQAGSASQRAEREAVMPELRQERSVQERSIGELFGQLTQDMTLLVRQEVQLARTEMSEKISRLTTNLISVTAGGLVAYMGAWALVAALILALHELADISPWVSALIVG